MMRVVEKKRLNALTLRAGETKVVFPQLGGAPLFIVRWWWLPRDSYRSTCEWDGQPTINTLVCQHESRCMIERLGIRKGAPSGYGKDFSVRRDYLR
jgi:hypothetical protein